MYVFIISCVDVCGPSELGLYNSLAPHAECKAPNITVLHYHIQDKVHHLFLRHSRLQLQHMVYQAQEHYQHCSIENC